MRTYKQSVASALANAAKFHQLVSNSWLSAGGSAAGSCHTGYVLNGLITVFIFILNNPGMLCYATFRRRLLVLTSRRLRMCRMSKKDGINKNIRIN